MATYVMLATLTDKGRADLEGVAQRRQKNIEELKQNGITVVADYALMGDYDFLYIVEAPDFETMMQQIAHDTTGGNVVFRTYAAMPLEQWAALTANIKQYEG